MPIITTLVTRRLSRRATASRPARRARSCTWPTISPGVRLRTSFCVPVWQKRQFSVQPTCEETQSVPRPGSGMKTVSNSMPGPGAQQPFARAVVRNLFGHDLGPRQRETLRHRGAEILGQIGHRREIARAVDVDPVPQLAHAHGRGLLRRRPRRSARLSTRRR